MAPSRTREGAIFIVPFLEEVNPISSAVSRGAVTGLLQDRIGPPPEVEPDILDGLGNLGPDLKSYEMAVHAVKALTTRRRLSRLGRTSSHLRVPVFRRILSVHTVLRSKQNYEITRTLGFLLET